jgi:hypothetical protein
MKQNKYGTKVTWTRSNGVNDIFHVQGLHKDAIINNNLKEA